MASIRDWETFVYSSRSFFDANRGSPLFRLIETLDDLYWVVHANGPFPKTGVERDDFLHKCFVICHWAMLAAATNTASGLPEDGPAITRRALEAAKVCLAIKAHPDNFDEWKAFEQRSARWSARASGDKPKGPPVSPRYKHVSSHPFYQEIQGLIGVLSDAAVHFTPEYFGGYIWQQTSNSNRDGTVDISFSVGENAVAYRCFQLIDQYLFIVRVFDHCLDGKLFANTNVRRSALKVIERLKELLVLEGLTEQARLVERGWRFLAAVTDA
jgi:hypothetical protein